MRYPPLVAVLLATGVCCIACETGSEKVRRQPGEPLAGLTEEEMGRFLLGRAVFDRLTTPEEGLGPLFNQNRCSSCHDLPTSGGGGAEPVTKATLWENGTCDLLVREGGDNIQHQATPLLRAQGITHEAYPASANGRVDVIPPRLYGAGLVEAIPDEVILAREDPDDADGDGISGRAARTADGRVGRFGRKLEHPTVFSFIEGALRAEMGLTTPMHPQEETINGVPIPPDTDPKEDPEIDERGINLLTDYVRFLAPSAREELSPAARDTVERGERVFETVGCGSCHVPSMRTGPNAVAAWDRKTVELYSDMLLHDLGPALADVCGPDASPSEYRTAPLMGLRFQDTHLHDGSAMTFRRAVMLHGGEASAVRARFSRLSVEDQTAILRFIASL
jgi:CxxC motif-containing protein (DUF1111 family)